MLYDRAWACNYDELITYYPLFYRDIKEMDAILRAHGKLADDLEAGIEQVFANNFIDTADEATIERLEKFLELGLNRSRTLEERRRLVKSFFAGFGRVSASMLAGIIQSYTEAAVSARFEPCDEAGNNMLYIEFGRGSSPTLYMSDINLLLTKKIPAHIKWQAAIVYPFPVGIGVRRTHYRFGYDLTGTKPDIAMIGLAIDLASVIETKKSAGLTGYEQASTDVQTGQRPDIATIGSYLTIKDVIEAKAEFYTTNLKKAQNGDLEAGVWPDITAIGQAFAAGLVSGAKGESHINNYDSAGTKPDHSQIGLAFSVNAVTEMQEKSYSHPHEQAGTKPDISQVAILQNTVSAASVKEQSYTVSHEAAGNEQAGVKPETSQETVTNEISAGAGVKATGYDVNYIYCGTQYSQS